LKHNKEEAEAKDEVLFFESRRFLKLPTYQVRNKNELTKF